MKETCQDALIIDASLEAGYEYSSDVFAKIIADAPHQISEENLVLQAAEIDTPLGTMVAMADEKSLYLLEFVATRRGLEREIKCLRKRGFVIIPGITAPILSIKNELEAYFEGILTEFKTPYQVFGSSFQQQVWQALCHIPYGETRSYAQQSALLGRANAYRAVGNANGMNQLAIIIPCHRVIASDGTLGGYGGGLSIKQWLLHHEKKHKR